MIYVDLLVIEDLFLNYIIILSTGLLLNRITKFKKVFLSSVIGTIPLIFLFLDIKNTIILLINITFCAIMSVTAFKYQNIIYTLKNIIYMYFISIFLAGTMYLIKTNFLPHINNYFLNFIILISISPIITYIYIKLLKKIKNNYSNYYLVDIYLKDKPKITLSAFLDTGNKLIDPYTRQPIILVNKNNIDISNEKTILVPYNTIDNHGLLTCIFPDKVYIHNVGYCKKSLIGIINKIEIEGATCILNSQALERMG